MLNKVCGTTFSTNNTNDNDEGNNNDEQFSGSTYDRHNSKHFQCLSSSDPHKIMRQVL